MEKQQYKKKNSGDEEEMEEYSEDEDSQLEIRLSVGRSRSSFAMWV
jgi:hypothetical protein